MYITPIDELSVEPMSKEDVSYFKKLEKLMLKCPERYELLSIGDADLSIIDHEASSRIEIHDSKAQEAGVVLGNIACAVPIATTTG